MTDDTNIPNDGVQASSDEQEVSPIDQAMSDVPADETVEADEIVDLDNEDAEEVEGEE